MITIWRTDDDQIQVERREGKGKEEERRFLSIPGLERSHGIQAVFADQE